MSSSFRHLHVLQHSLPVFDACCQVSSKKLAEEKAWRDWNCGSLFAQAEVEKAASAKKQQLEAEETWPKWQ